MMYINTSVSIHEKFLCKAFMALVYTAFMASGFPLSKKAIVSNVCEL